MLINIDNSGLYKAQGIQQTYVASAISAGGTSSPVKNIAGMNNQWAQGFGQLGEETAEIMIISGAPSGTALNFGTSPSHTGGTFLFAHAQDTPIYQIHYDQIVINRSITGTGGAFSALATVSITPDSQFTSYNDASGAVTYAYAVQYYNSVSGDLSGSSSMFVPGGPTFYSLQSLRKRTKDKLYSAGYIKDDSLIDSWINEGIEDFSNAAIKVNQEYMLGTATYGFGTSGLGTITDTSFIRPVKCEVTYDGGVSWINSRKMPLREYSESDYFSVSTPRHIWTGDTTFMIAPHTQAGSARITYAVRFTPLVNDSDELTQTLKAYTTAFVEYALSVAYGLDQKDGESQQHYQIYEQNKANFVAQVTPRDLTGAETIDITSSVSGLDDDISSDIGNFW